MTHFEPEFGENERLAEEFEASEEPESTWVALPDPEDAQVDWACWLCQAEAPGYTMEIMNEETGLGLNYKLCHDCVERLIGQLEEGRQEQ